MNIKKLTAKVGLSLPVITLLAALALPRVIAHDFGWINEADIINKLLVYIPLIIWVAVALRRRVSSPILTLCVVGLTFGVMLAITHQIAWMTFWENGQPPRLGGNFDGQFPAGIDVVILRTVTFISSLLTGLVMGFVAGLVAFGVKFIFPVTNSTKKQI